VFVLFSTTRSTRKPLSVSGSVKSGTRNPFYEIVKVMAVMRLPVAFGAQKDKVFKRVRAALCAMHNVMGLHSMGARTQCAFATVNGVCLAA
jgi:hypothetical protein